MHNDPVNHPAHYTTGKYECIDFILNWNLDFCLGNAVKYLTRAGKKNNVSFDMLHKSPEIQDLEKAKWYIKKSIQSNPYLAYKDPPVDSIPPDEYADEQKLSPDLEPILRKICLGYRRKALDLLDEYIERRITIENH